MKIETVSTHSPCRDEYLLSNGDKLNRQHKSLILNFAGKRNVLSTSAFQGGYQEDLTCVFNFDEKPEHGNQCEMRADTYEEHLRKLASQELSLDTAHCTGLSTAADMENMAIEMMTENMSEHRLPPLTVTAIVTGGIDKNGARAGDPACWSERNGNYFPVPGTINIFLHINANLSKGAMARALVTCTEAKTVAVTELFCPSLYSSGLATGSGTDGVILICDAESPLMLTAAGKDSRLGEMIAKTVIPAVKKTISLQTNVTPQSQHHAIRRLERFGLTENKLYDIYLQRFSPKRNQKKAPEKGNSSFSEALSKTDFFQSATPLLASGYWTGKASLLAHLLDQLQWGMLSSHEVSELTSSLFPGSALAAHEVSANTEHKTEDFLHQFCEEFLLFFQ